MKMKKILVVLLCVFFCFSAIAMAKEITTKFKWDADTTAEGATEARRWENLYFYERFNETPYDFTTPVFILPQSYVDDISEPSMAELTTALEDGIQTTVYWVLRAEANGLFSVNSDEVFRVFDLTPINAVTEFTAVYNKETNSIDMVWNNLLERVKEWKVFVSDTAGGPYEPFETVARDGEVGPITASKAIEAPENQLTQKYFVLVSYAEHDIFSEDSVEVMVEVDRRTLIPPVQGIKIELSIPVVP